MNSEGSVRQCSWQQGMRIAVFELSIWASCLYNCSPYVLSRWLYAYVHPLFGSWWSQWGVMAARHFCHSWCKWWSDTLWAALPRLWLHLLFLCFFGFGWNGHNSYPQCVLVEYSLWSHGYISIWARWLSQPVPYVIAMCVELHRYVCVQLLLKQLYLWMGAGLSCKSREFPQKCRQGLLESSGWTAPQRVATISRT